MPQYRSYLLIALFTPSLLTMGCGLVKSENEGKIVAKWQLMDNPEIKPMGNFFGNPDALVTMEFQSDGTYLAGVEYRKAEQTGLRKVSDVVPPPEVLLKAKYKLGIGDQVEIYDLPADQKIFIGKGKAILNISIKDRNMTLKSGSTVFALVKM